MAIALILFMGAFNSQHFAQQKDDALVGKACKLHIWSSVMVGNILLESGMYHVQHVTEGVNHLIIFRIMKMGYKSNMGEQTPGEEVARMKCRIEPVGKRWKHTKLQLERNSSGQKVVRAVQIADEDVLHKLDSQL